MDKKKLSQFIGLLATVTAAVVIGNYIVKAIDKKFANGAVVATPATPAA